MLKKTQIVLGALSLIAILVLSACGSDDPPTPPQVNQARVFTGPLSQKSAVEVEQFIKNGIYATSIIEISGNGMIAAPPTSSESAVSSSDNFSQTNTIEQGVDESDRIKYDGTYMYVAQASTYNYEAPVQPEVRVLKRNQDFSLTALPNISSSLEFEKIEGIYLHDNSLAVVGSSYRNSQLFFNQPITRPEVRVSLSIFDVTNPQQSTESVALQIDGSVLATRRINDSLYIISTYVPSVDNLTLGESTDLEKINNFNVVSQTPISQIMPKRYQDGQQIPLNSPEDCYIPAQATSQDGYAQFLTVTKINLAVPTDIQSTCLTTIANVIYMSPSNLYLAVNVNNQDTLFHKIDLTTLDYSASGSVAGQLSWRANPLFRLHENDNMLRVVTTSYEQADPVHTLSVLQQQGSELTTIASLPNAASPQLIGKPGEDIFAVRFIKDKAYVVTFENIDPLYVINLSDAANPFIEGELEIPGFSRYIQPLNNGYLLGIGQQISANRLPQPGVTAIAPPQNEGMKISLFDVRDPANPLEVTNLVTPNAYTPVEFEYKALSVLNTDGVYRFALPFEQWGDFGVDSPSNDVINNLNSVMLLETDTKSSSPALSLINKITALPNTAFYFGARDDRSIIQGNKVYYLRGNDVWLSEWSQNSETLGPY